MKKTALAWTFIAALVLLAGFGSQKRMQSRISAEVFQMSIQAHQSAGSLSEWRDSEVYSERIFKKLIEDQKTLCPALLGLSADHLALFDREVRFYSKDFALEDCAETLLKRLEAYWQEKAFELRENPNDALKGTLKSLEVEVDPLGGYSTSDGGLKEKQIALTFDDGPGEDTSLSILEILNQWGVRATYFQVGENAHRFAQISSEIGIYGHSIGSHTYTHPKLTSLPFEEAQNEIQTGRDAVAHSSGVAFSFFRFPYGASNAALKGELKARGLANFFWNMDSLDWKITDPVKLFQNVVAELDREKKGILLFHDIHRQTQTVLPRVLKELQNRGYTTVVFTQ